MITKNDLKIIVVGFSSIMMLGIVTWLILNNIPGMLLGMVLVIVCFTIITFVFEYSMSRVEVKEE